jgi:hypothetical protein
MCVNETLNGFIVEADVVIGNVEHTCLTTSVDTISSQYGVDVETILADTAYSTGENLTAMEERKVELLAPLAEVTCPGGASQAGWGMMGMGMGADGTGRE